MPAHNRPNTPLSSNKNSSAGTWGEAVLAAIPHLLVGLVFVLPATLSAMGLNFPVIRIKSTGAYLGVLDLVLVGILLVSLVSILAHRDRARRSGRPAGRWTASWYGYGFLLVSAALLVILQAWRTQILGGRLAEAVMTYYFTPTLLATSTLLLGPLLIGELWQLGKRGGEASVWSYRLAVAGLALALAANLASFWWLTTGYPVPPPEFPYTSIRLAFASAVYLGLLLFLAGALFFGVPALQDASVHNQAAFLLLLFFMLTLPFTAILPAAFGSRFTLPGLPVALYDLGDTQLLLAAILAWVLLVSWLAAQLARKGPSLNTL